MVLRSFKTSVTYNFFLTSHQITLSVVKQFLSNIILFLAGHCLRSSANILSCKLQASCNFIKKETLAQVFSCEFCEISKNTFFDRTPPVTASVDTFKDIMKIFYQHWEMNLKWPRSIWRMCQQCSLL